ncbi:hypothetical protein A0J61_07326 [Choanephora cucurbitarum]|uniref:Uncharacterized protein n=1 Tax=Choanephora cucurbitarum TaxID=101091 RepID=A0A1C7N671_9FUNG|nr:hypothetical protein A0J61_07326 [Choanephora cucurbitarum]
MYAKDDDLTIFQNEPIMIALNDDSSRTKGRQETERLIMKYVCLMGFSYIRESNNQQYVV